MIPSVSPAIYIYQICYSEDTISKIETGYLILDNLKNDRPDWFEYWPIRNFLLKEKMDEEGFYGFVSPKFGQKTQLTYRQVIDFIQSKSDDTDVFIFSPQPDMGAFFLNIFEQGETFDPGLIDCFEEFLKAIRRPTPLRQLVMDSRQIVFSNYFVAKPAFWREWLSINEALYAICEGPATPLQQSLTHVTTYPGAVQRKVFLIERVASLLLTTQSQWRTRSANPFTMGWSTARFREHPTDAFISDALKMAWRDQGYPEYLKAFSEVRNRFVSSGQKSTQ
jgi:hypothetical protein